MPSNSIECLQSLDPIEFENLVTALLLKMGFNATTTKASGDGGIDIVAISEQPIISGKYIIQCKRYATGSNIGEPIVRELYGVMHAENANKGILITTSDFSRQAISFACNKAIELIDGNSLIVLIDKHFENVVYDDAINESYYQELYEGILMNEPTDFRGVHWGSNIRDHNDMIFIKHCAKACSEYQRISDTKKFGSAVTESPLYYFDDDGRFIGVTIRYFKKDNYERLLNHLYKTHGKPKSDDFSHKWYGKTVEIWLAYNSDYGLGDLSIDYLPLKDLLNENYVKQVALEKQQKQSQCFVATAIYGSPSASELVALRYWRDNTLYRYCLGRCFIVLYYKLGPVVANYIEDKSTIKYLLRKMCDMFIRLLRI